MVPSGGAVGTIPAGFASFSPQQVVVTSTILRIDTEAPTFLEGSYANDDSNTRVWLRSGDRQLAILEDGATPVSTPPAPPVGALSGTELAGFSVLVMGGPNTRTISVTSAVYYSSTSSFDMADRIILTLDGELAEDDVAVANYEYPGTGLGILTARWKIICARWMTRAATS